MSIEWILPIAVLSFACGLMDSTLGMGYGTTLTPLLLLMGYEPMEIVPAVLIAQCVGGLVASVFHHGLGNVDLRPGSRDFKVMLVMSSLGVVGALLAVGVAINLPAWVVKVYIGVLVLGIGVAILLLLCLRRPIAFSWRRVAGLGFLAAFNKGISGGGYGPVVTGGQVLAGVSGANAVGIAALAEGITSAVAILAYLASGAPLPWLLTPSLTMGAVLAVPFAAFLVSRISTGRLTLAIGSLTTLLGGYTLVRLIF